MCYFESNLKILIVLQYYYYIPEIKCICKVLSGNVDDVHNYILEIKVTSFKWVCFNSLGTQTVIISHSCDVLVLLNMKNY